jgi:hypothetical protein
LKAILIFHVNNTLPTRISLGTIHDLLPGWSIALNLFPCGAEEPSEGIPVIVSGSGFNDITPENAMSPHNYARIEAEITCKVGRNLVTLSSYMMEKPQDP